MNPPSILRTRIPAAAFLAAVLLAGALPAIVFPGAVLLAGSFPAVEFLAPVFLAAEAAPAWGRPAREPGTRFYGLIACENRIVFVAEDAGGAADTLALDPTRGKLFWLGGPVRGLARADGNTVCVATRLGVHVLTSSIRWFARWTVPPGGPITADPAGWPKTRTPLPSTPVAPTVPGEVTPFPERYIPLADGNLMFLVDAANPPDNRTLRYDLHTRFETEVEWRVARNLEVRGWVVSPDSLSWALVGRVHRPDYGGEVRDVVLAGRHATSQTFFLDGPRALLWDGAGRLWVWTAAGSLTRLEPGDGAWRVEAVDLAETDPPCAPGEAESIWVWTDPRSFSDRMAALRAARSATGDHTPTPWAAEGTRGAWQACWGGFLTEAALRDVAPDPPAPEARITRVPAAGFLGPAGKLRDPDLAGTATLRSALHHGRPASELWWRFDGTDRPVRMAGPWIAPELTPDERTSVMETP